MALGAEERLPGPLSLSKPELAVFVSGVTSMGLEILAGRMVAPQFGSSIYTWGTIIGVFLAALSWGYHRGGKRAAHDASVRELSWLFLVTALYVAGLIFLGDLIIRSTVAFPLPSRMASLPAVVILFGPPTYLLGFVSPYAAQLSAKEGTGEASGHVYMLGTVGSIVGAFATTYLLVPSLGIEAIGLVFGLLSVGTGLALVDRRRDRDRVLGALALAMVLVLVTATGAAGINLAGQTVYQTQTPYQQLRVVDQDQVRTLYLDGQRHSAMDLITPTRHVFDYTRHFHLPFLMVEEPDDIERVLFVGGGGFSGPRRFVHDYENVTVDVVEIDPVVVDVAKEYFRVEEGPRLNVHVGDGRQFLRDTNRTYDVIVLDAYRKDKAPFHLTTVEFMRLVDARLSDDGVVLMNVISAPEGPASEFYRAEYKTVSQVFPQVYGFQTNNASVVQNIELVATKDSARLTEAELLARNERRDIGIDLADEIRGYRAGERTDDVPLLTDDRAPVDALLDPLVGQRYEIQTTAPNATRASA